MVANEKRTLAGLLVRQAMRRQLVVLNVDSKISQAINTLIKYKVNAALLTDADGQPQGVISKTDVMGAYYAELPLESPLSLIMNAPPHYCMFSDSLESALDQMRGLGIYRLYVKDDDQKVVGVLAYPDIVGLLYRFCHDCKYSRRVARSKPAVSGQELYLQVKDVMTSSVESVNQDDNLADVMEMLTVHRFGAVMVVDEDNRPAGVISKTDLILAYRHGLGHAEKASAIMSRPVRSCQKEQWLEDAIRTMIISDIHRLFVYGRNPDKIEGVLSLSDAARARSGSCQACVSSRINVEQ